MTVVLDCNIIVMSLTSRSDYHRIYRALVSGHFDMAVSSEMMIGLRFILYSSRLPATHQSSKRNSTTESIAT